MHDAQRIAGLGDVQPRERAPGAADRVEGTAASCLQRIEAVELVLDDALGALDRLVRHVGQRKAAERKAHPAPDPLAGNVDQLERAAAEVADDTVSVVDGRDHTQRRQLCLARAGQNLDGRAEDAFGAADEFGAVVGLAAGRSGDHEGAADMHDAAQRTKAAQRRQRARHRIGRKQARGVHLAAEAAQDLLVEERRQAARQRLVDDETNRVGADVDNGDRRPRFARGVRKPLAAKLRELTRVTADVPTGA
jgi:hypothetical protein